MSREENLYSCKWKEEMFVYTKVECPFINCEILRKALNSLIQDKYVYLRLKNLNINLISSLFSSITVKNLEFPSSRKDSLTNDNQPELFYLENHLEVFRG